MVSVGSVFKQPSRPTKTQKPYWDLSNVRGWSLDISSLQIGDNFGIGISRNNNVIFYNACGGFGTRPAALTSDQAVC